MRVAVVSDIHGNRHAFEAVLDAVESRPARSSGASATWSVTAPIRTPAWRSPASTPRSAWPATTTSACAARCRWSSSPAARRWRRPGPGTRSASRPASTSTASARQLEESVGLYHASPRDPVWEYVLSPLQAELCLDVQPQRVSLIGHSHVALSFSRFPGAPATGQTRAADEELDLKRANGWSTPAASASLVTAILAPPGSSSTSTSGGRSTGGPITTSPAPPLRSGPPGCPIRWPSGCCTASDGRGRCAATLTSSQPGSL